VRFPGLEDADDRVTYVYTTILGAQQALAGGPAAEADGPVLEGLGGVVDAFREAMANDFNTPAALAVLSQPLADVNGLLASAKGVDKQLRRRSLARFLADFQTIGGVLGLFQGEPAAWLARRRDLKAARLGLDVARVTTLLEERAAARTARDWGQADRCRDDLAALGVCVLDGPAGTTWTL
jgi:cysteinyl-tRNA synthetase